MMKKKRQYKRGVSIHLFYRMKEITCNLFKINNLWGLTTARVGTVEDSKAQR